MGDLQGKNFVPHEDDAAWGDACAGDPDFGHGTKVAGIAAASTDNRIDIAGTAYRAPIASYRIGAADCAFPNIQAAHDAIVYAVNNDAYAINISTGFPAGQYEDWKVAQLRDAVDYAWSQNVPVVAAVGQTSSAEEGKGGLNGFSSWVPQRWEHVITVGGTDEFDRRCEWELGRAPNKQYWGANYGDPGIDVSAPCKRIVSTSTDGTRTGPGTSFAAPFVAGVVFLIKSEHPNWTSAQIKARIQNTADKVGGYDYGYRSFCGGQSRELGCGLLDAHAAVD